jgi:hypothetical protein
MTNIRFSIDLENPDLSEYLEMLDKRRMLHIKAPLLAYVNSLALLFV